MMLVLSVEEPFHIQYTLLTQVVRTSSVQNIHLYLFKLAKRETDSNRELRTIPSRTGRIKAGASVFAKGSATRTSIENVLLAYAPSSLVTPPPPVNTMEVMDFLCSVSYCIRTLRTSEKMREKTSSGLPSVPLPPIPSSFLSTSALAIDTLPDIAIARVMS